MERNKGENEQIRIVFWNVAGIKNKENVPYDFPFIKVKERR
jgi:hypothetical protein